MPEKPLAQKNFRYQTIIVAHIVVYLRGGYGSSQNGLPNATQNQHDQSICGPLNFDQDQPNTYISSFFCIYVMDTQLYAVPILLLKPCQTIILLVQFQLSLVESTFLAAQTLVFVHLPTTFVTLNPGVCCSNR